MPTANLPTPITNPARRRQAATIVTEASGLTSLTAGLLVDIVDVTTAATLGSVGLSTIETRRAMAALWA